MSFLARPGRHYGNDPNRPEFDLEADYDALEAAHDVALRWERSALADVLQAFMDEVAEERRRALA